MAQEEEKVVVVADVAESVQETLDEDRSSSASPSDNSSAAADPSLSRNVSFSKLNAKAPEFVPTRPQQQQQQPPPPPPPPPPPAAAPMMHIYTPPPGSFHVPIHSPVAPPHVIPVHHHHHHQHHHHAQQYVPVRNPNSQGSHYVAAGHYQGNHNQHYHHHQHHYGKKAVQTEHSEGDSAADKDKDKDSASRSKNDKNGLSDEATQKLLNQVEYYFSDLNLATTDHLMRFINKDPEGYVPISVVASFKKIKAAVSSNVQLATILRNSSKLIVSEDGKKVKRLHPLTESDVEELQSRIVVAENLPEDHCHQNLMKIFSAVGSVRTIRTCPPQPASGGASSASRAAKADGMHFSNKLHAFVEYESVEIAEKAVTELNDEGNWRCGLRVRLMLKQTSKTAQARGKKGHTGQGHVEEDEISMPEQQPTEHQMEDHSQQEEVQSQENYLEDRANDKEGAQKKGRSRGRGKGRGRVQYHHNNRGNHVGTPPSSSLVVNEQPTMAKQPPGPRMPDGTRGFAMGRGKPAAVNVA